MRRPYLYLLIPHPGCARLDGWAAGLMVLPAMRSIVRNGATRLLAMRVCSHMPAFLGHVVKCRVAVDLGFRRFEHHALLGGVGRSDRARRHYPDRQPFAAACVDITRGLQRQRGVGGVQRANMLVRETIAAANEDFP